MIGEENEKISIDLQANAIWAGVLIATLVRHILLPSGGY